MIYLNYYLYFVIYTMKIMLTNYIEIQKDSKQSVYLLVLFQWVVKN